MKVNTSNLKSKKLIIFDLDGTLAESKSDLAPEMALLLKELLGKKIVAVIGGGRFEQFQKQFVAKLESGSNFANLFLFPMSASAFYKYANNSWQKVYEEELSENEKKQIFDGFEKTFKELNYSHPEKVYGEVIEDRGAQITFSALGQEAPLELKEKWKNEHSGDKMKIAKTLEKYLPDFSVGAAGYTSIDVSRKGIDKEYGIKQIEKYLNIPISEMLFIGDALFPGGNDYAVINTGIDYITVKSPKETKEIISVVMHRDNA